MKACKTEEIDSLHRYQRTTHRSSIRLLRLHQAVCEEPPSCWKKYTLHSMPLAVKKEPNPLQWYANPKGAAIAKTGSYWYRLDRTAKMEGSFLCGVIEGFYGRPWSKNQRLELLDHMSSWKGLNTFIYSPKDDKKHRAHWRALYDRDEVRSEGI
jgi:hypothetical protein